MRQDAIRRHNGWRGIFGQTGAPEGHLEKQGVGTGDVFLHIAYLVDAGELDPEGDLEEQFLDWRQVRWETVSGETHYQGVPRASQGRPRCRPNQGAEFRGRTPGWPGRGRGEAGTGWRAARAFTASPTMSTGRRVSILDPASESTWWPLTGADRRVLCPEDHQGRLPGNSPALAILAEEIVDLG